MAKLYKTARGKSIDMDKLKLANESTVAVGNMKTNARGDLLGAGGQITATRNQVMDRVYAVEEAPYNPQDPAIFKRQQALMEANNKQLESLANNLIVPSNPTDTAPVPAARGELANSIANTAAVKQEPLKSLKELKKSQGPSRI